MILNIINTLEKYSYQNLTKFITKENYESDHIFDLVNAINSQN